MTVVDTQVSAGLGRILLNRPDVMNAVSLQLATELEEALRDLGSRDDVRVIVIRGAGGNFCSGGDFAEVSRLRDEGPAALDTLFAAFRRACATIRQIGQPVVVAAEGVAMAGGFELMQAADIALVRDDARLSDNHANHAMVPGGGGSQRLPRLLGRQRALSHLLTGERLSGLDAERLGLALHSFSPSEFEERVEAFLERLATKDPGSLRTIKQLVYDGLELTLEESLDLEQRTVVDHICSPVRSIP